ncbi:MAG: T9SS C-terminal target domain-containing protein [Chlorobi bacterium CHB2]|nr:T9SS C-terminal target domain-containing protein [Chlorobi bacterium CHB2]
MARLLTTLLLMLLAGSQSYAQFLRAVDTTKPPLRPMYGVGNDEFYLSGYFQKWGPLDAQGGAFAGAYDDLWQHSHFMGLPIVHINIKNDDYDDFRLFYDDTLRQSTDRIALTMDIVHTIGWGQAIEFYAFDSVQSLLYPCKFLHRQGGILDTNKNTAMWNGAYPVLEQRYTTGNTGVNDSIMWGVVYGYNAERQVYSSAPYSMPIAAFEDSVQNRTGIIQPSQNHRIGPNGGAGDTIHYIVLTGHLSSTPNNTVDNDSALLRIDIIHDLPKYYDAFGAQTIWYDSTLSGHTITANTERHCRSFYVRKGELLDSNLAWNAYKEAVFPVNLRWYADGKTPGPDHPLSTSRRFDIRVHWLGVDEDVAIRSVSIRDSAAQLALGREARCQQWRTESMMKYLKKLFYGQNAEYYDNIAGLPVESFRKNIIALQSGEEQYPNEYGGFAAMQKLVADSFNLAKWKAEYGGTLQEGDSVRLFSFDLGNANFTKLSGNRQSSVYLYINDPRDTVKRFGSYWVDSSHISPQHIFETDVHQIPSILEHNGGRGHLPLLDLTTEGVEKYNTAWQRMFLGRYHPGTSPLYSYPYNKVPGLLDELGESAVIARNQGVRNIPLIGTAFALSIRDSASSGAPKYDTLVSHIPEGSELWTLANCALAYGAKGVLWWYLGSVPHVLSTNQLGHWFSNSEYDCCFGSQGYYWQDNYQNTLDYQLFDKGGASPRITIPNFYVGWGDRTSAIRTINRYLARIGPTLMKLRWRDAYSIHHTVRNPNLTRDTLFRPLPANEIVSNVTSRKPGAALDAPERTFVELGLFQTVTDSAGNRINDTNYLYVVNRRSFTRPDSISATSTRGRTMDTLADTRTINLQFNLQHPDTNGYNLIRVREIAIDSSAIPLAGQLRKPMDTVIGCRSIASLTLPPGRGSLLQITYAEPGDQAMFGDLRFNNQRKFLFDGLRWHAVYQRKRPLETSVDDYDADILYRRSYPVKPNTGGIKWEADEYDISKTIAPADTAELLICHQNRFPSMTLHVRGKDTCIAIVWTAHHDPLKRERKVMLRMLRYDTTRTVSGNDTTQLIVFNPKEVVSLYRSADGKATETWGTPVINAHHGGHIIAWSDDSLGVRARGRVFAPMPAWWGPAGTYSVYTIDVSNSHPLSGIGKYPSVPAFAHGTSKDSNCAIVWQHTTAAGANTIAYWRLQAVESVGGLVAIGGAGWSGVQDISQGGSNFHPSIDQTQFHLGTVQEGVTWESVDWSPTYISPSDDTTFMNVTSINYIGMATETRLRQDTIYPWEPQHDWIQFSYPVGAIQKFPALFPNWWYTTVQSIYSAWFAWPNIGSANESATQDHQNDTTRFSIVGNTMNDEPRIRSVEGMQHVSVPFGFGQPTALRKFVFSGAWPQASSSPLRQAGRQGTLYEAYKPTPDSLLQATREFMARQRPQEYIATGREVEVMVDDTARAFFAVQMADPWVATDSASWGLGMIQRDTAHLLTNSIASVQDLFRSNVFFAHDTAVIGCELRGMFRGDTAYAHGYSLRLIAEVVNASNHQAVAQLDSFCVSKADTAYNAQLQDTLDLLSGSYYVRLRIEADSFPAISRWWQPLSLGSMYPVAEVANYVEARGGLGKLRREGTSTTAQARISAQPNPFTGTTELRFSIPKPGYASVRVFNPVGRQMAEVVPKQWMEIGRYAAEFNAAELPPGTYLVELMLGQHRVVEKIVVVR